MSDNETFPRKSFLMLLNTSSPQKEHAKIMEILLDVSNREAKPVYFDRHGAAILFNTAVSLGHIIKRFEGSVFNDDRYLIVELGDQWATWGNGIAAGWLRHNLGKGDEHPGPAKG